VGATSTLLVEETWVVEVVDDEVTDGGATGCGVSKGEVIKGEVVKDGVVEDGGHEPSIKDVRLTKLQAVQMLAKVREVPLMRYPQTG
jgi:hypothetical protein